MKYHKIQTIFKRDPQTNHKTLLMWDFSLHEFEFLQNNEWVFTEKVDGTNIRVMWDGQSVTFNGKTDNAQLPGRLANTLPNMFPPDLVGSVFNDVADVTMYGEGYGAGIQKGGVYRQDQSFVLFDVLVNGQFWLQRGDVDDIANKLGCQSVPIIGTGNLEKMIDITRGGLKSQWGDFVAEGIVARPKVELFCRNGDRVITKLKYKDFQGE